VLGANNGLFFPRMMLAAKTAKSPRTISEASISNHFLAAFICSFFGIVDFCIFKLYLRTTN
jgi:hypothetical protein